MKAPIYRFFPYSNPVPLLGFKSTTYSEETFLTQNSCSIVVVRVHKSLPTPASFAIYGLLGGGREEGGARVHSNESPSEHFCILYRARAPVSSVE